MAENNAVRSTPDNLRVIYEDNHLIAVNKRASDIVQGDRTGDVPLSEVVKTWIGKKYNKPGNVFLGVIHRLDRPVSGVVVFAKTGKALARMNNLFRDKKVQKTYWAVVCDQPPQSDGKLVDYLQKNQKQNKSYVTKNTSGDAKKAELTYRMAGSGDRYHFLEVLPVTGRHHQIRVQLANMGCIIKGDLKYRAPRSNKDASIHLHARQIEFIHPVKQEPLKIVAPAPETDALWQEFERISARSPA